MLQILAFFSGLAVATAPGQDADDARVTAEQSPAAAEAEPLDPDRLEIGGTPALGFDSNTGFAFGAIVTLAKFAPDQHPYAWRLEALAYMSVMETAGRWDLPFHDHHLLVDIPNLWDGWVRLNLNLAFGRTLNNGYYGFGNGAEYDPGQVEANPRYYEYDWIHPHADAKARIKIWHGDAGKLDLMAGTGFTFNVINIFAGSKLEEDLAGASGAVTEALLVGAGDHGLVTGIAGVSFDSRDHEFCPRRGMFHEISLRGGVGLGMPFVYGGLNLTARFFFPLWEEYLVLATRFLADLSFGDVPFYQLPSQESLFPDGATGGATSIRGVLGQRYHGKIKLLGNVELRSKIMPLTVFGERFNIGATAFVDAGRIWADFAPHPSLDDGAARYKLGAGGGVRIQWGETFILRADFAYSPTEDTIGYYVDIDHVF